MSVQRLPVALLLFVSVNVSMLLSAKPAEAGCCACDQPCKWTCTCCYGCHAGPLSQESPSATSQDTSSAAELGGDLAYQAVAQLNFREGLQHLMRGGQCVRDKFLLRLLGVTDLSAKLNFGRLGEVKGIFVSK